MSSIWEWLDRIDLEEQLFNEISRIGTIGDLLIYIKLIILEIALIFTL